VRANPARLVCLGVGFRGFILCCRWTGLIAAFGSGKGVGEVGEAVAELRTRGGATDKGRREKRDKSFRTLSVEPWLYR
jgi:hypothetical protein